ncbi:MAG: toll/interleukin-1 receptor domain-containing protein [Chloroflexi bacterium]|nr:toll/interleukin-1 receptor domain-containing protein [Chloroflexota bacterium]
MAERGVDFSIETVHAPLTAENLSEVYAAIETADVVLVVISPDAMASDMCRLQVTHASRRNKRLVPVIYRDVDVNSVPADLARLNWIFLRQQDSGSLGFDALIESINLDLEWLHAHTRLLVRALEWQRTGASPSLLLRGGDLREMEQSLRRAETAQPPASALQLEYVQASREAAAISRCFWRGALSSIGVGLVWAASFVPIAINLVQQVAPDSSALQLAGEIIVPLFAGTVAASIFAIASFGALLLERHLTGSAIWRLQLPILVGALGAVTLGSAAGFQVPLALYGSKIPVDLPLAVEIGLLLSAGLGTAILQSLVLEGMLFSMRRVRVRRLTTARLRQPARAATRLVLPVVAGLCSAAVALGLFQLSTANVLTFFGHPADLFTAAVLSVVLVVGVSALVDREPYHTLQLSSSTVSQEPVAEDRRTAAARVFISYSRKDAAFVRSLHAALLERGLEAWVDWEGIPLTADFLQEIYAAIEGSDAFVFIVSPDSVTSEVCGLELAHAEEQHKRIVPVVYRAVEADAAPEPLRNVEPVVLAARSDLSDALAHLCEAVSRDLVWVQLHTRVLTRAIEWQRKLRQESFLLAGQTLHEVESVFRADRHITIDPSPTSLQVEYLLQSWWAAVHRQVRSRAWLLSVAFGGLCALLVVLPLVPARNFSSGALVFIGVATGIGASVCRGLLAGAMALERRRKVEYATRERRFPVAIVVLIATMAGCGSLIAMGLYIVGVPEFEALVYRPLGAIIASVVAAGAAVMLVRLVLLPYRRLSTFHIVGDSGHLLEVRRRGSLKRFGVVLLVLGALEVGWAARSGLVPVSMLVVAFGVSGACLGLAAFIHARSRHTHGPAVASSVAGVVAGGVFGVGGCAVLLPPISLIILLPGVLNIVATTLAAAVAAASVLVLEPKARR